MPTPPRAEAVLRRAVAAVREHGSVSAAARVLGMNRVTLQNHVDAARAAWPDCLPPASCNRAGGWAAPDKVYEAPDDWQGADPAFEYPEAPSAEPTYEELKAQRVADFERLHAHKEAIKLIRVKVKIEGPYGIFAKGDPHLDNPGTDWPLLNKHIALIKKTEGLFAANVGDLSDNWVGRLSRLYAESNVSRTRAITLVEGYLREVRFLWIDPGNHDLWSGAEDPVRWITRFAGLHYKWQGSRLELVPPSGASVIVNSRHDHPGHSMYHPTHGPLKAALMDGYGDDIYTCGHIHAGAYHLHIHPDGRASHLLRLSSYKVYDHYKDERGFKDAHLPAGVFVINPHATTQHARTVFFADPEEGAAYLTYARAKFASGRTVGVVETKPSRRKAA